jgi:predicted O-methyltransferase YrrM
MQTPVLTEILRTRKVYASDGNAFDLHSSIDEDEGRAIYELIKDQTISTSLEVGCAYGISSLYICDALSTRQTRHHTIIDPAQSTGWRGIGISNLRRAGFDFFSLIEKPSEIALSELLASGKKFQFIFIDGWHTFDHTLLDFFYANRLLEDGGFVAIDDADWPGIRKVISYVSKYPNYRVYKKVNSGNGAGLGSSGAGIRHLVQRIRNSDVRDLPKRLLNLSRRALARSLSKSHSPSTMVIFQKTGPDTRKWDWYKPF